MLHRMKRLGLFAIALALGCNTTSDGDTDTDGNSGGGSTVSDTEDGTETATDTVTDSANTETASGSATTEAASTSTTDASDSSSSGSSSTGGSSSSGSSSSGSSSTGELGPQALCEATAGTWDPTACGDYVCGIPNDCEALIPGCDCGQDANFVEGEGCVADDVCSTFECGDALECAVAAEYCIATFPGVKGAPITYACQPMPEECSDSVDCVCLTMALMLPPPPICDEPVPDGLVVQVFLP